MLGYINTCQGDKILHLDTKYCVQEDTTPTHLPVKFLKKYFTSYGLLEKFVCTKGALIQEYLHSWPNFFRFIVQIPGNIFIHHHKSP